NRRHGARFMPTSRSKSVARSPMSGFPCPMGRSTDMAASEDERVDSTMTSRIDEAARMCEAALRQRPAGLFSDFDGTLSEIAPLPEDAVFYEGAREALIRVASLVDVAGIITGRAVDDVLARTKAHELPELLVVGNHGLEWLDYGN